MARQCAECRDGEHENYDDKVRLVLVRDPVTKKFQKRAYLCDTHVEMYQDDGLEVIDI